jgi:hypothetical protein
VGKFERGVKYGLGPVAAADYAAAFECYANQWLAWNGYATSFVFQPIPLPAIA